MYKRSKNKVSFFFNFFFYFFYVTHSSILTKIMRYFSPVRDIATFKRTLHCVMVRAECSARVFHRRNKPRNSRIAIICRSRRKLCVISLPFEIFRRLNALCTAFCEQNVLHACPPASKQAQIFANCNNSSISSNIKSYFSPTSDISAFKRSLSLHYACRT